MNLRIVLVEPAHPGNIGAVARAMKNMGLTELWLVRPRGFPHPEATARASGADDVLAGARSCDALAEALRGCGWVAGTTARERDQNYRVLDVRAAAVRAVQEARRGSAALLFGAERTGLANDDLDCCHALIRIPANPAYCSLNLAMAVQLVAYETWRARLGADAGSGYGDGPQQARRLPPARSAAPLAAPEELERLYAHLGEVLEEIDFRDRTRTGTHLMARLRRFIQRAEPDQNEVNILRGILTAVQQRRRRAGLP